jgi:hypothetical protein
MSKEDYILSKDAFTEGYDLLWKVFSSECCISNDFTGIKNDDAKYLFNKMKIYPDEEYDSDHAFLMFVFVFILFDTIFQEESIASACQLVPERKTAKADQYLDLISKSNKMRNILLGHVLYNIKFDNSNILEYGIDDIVIEGIMLMLAACEKTYQHINSDFVNSEYLNRASFSAIITRLEKVFYDIGICIPKCDAFVDFIDMNTTRFALYYNKLQLVFKALNPPRKRTNKELNDVLKGITFMNLMNKIS